MPRAAPDGSCALRGDDRLPLAHMQIRMKSTGKHDWTLLLRARPMPHPEPESTSLPGASASIEEQERLAKSKLERLAAELRALGIQF